MSWLEEWRSRQESLDGCASVVTVRHPILLLRRLEEFAKHCNGKLWQTEAGISFFVFPEQFLAMHFARMGALALGCDVTIEQLEEVG